MTTREQIIAAAREAGLGYFKIKRSDKTSVDALERFWQIAFEAGRQAEQFDYFEAVRQGALLAIERCKYAVGQHRKIDMYVSANQCAEDALTIRERSTK